MWKCGSGEVSTTDRNEPNEDMSIWPGSGKKGNSPSEEKGNAISMVFVSCCVSSVFLQDGSCWRLHKRRSYIWSVSILMRGQPWLRVVKDGVVAIVLVLVLVLGLVCYEFAEMKIKGELKSSYTGASAKVGVCAC